MKEEQSELDPDVLNTYLVESVSQIAHDIPKTNTSVHELLGNVHITYRYFDWWGVKPEEVIAVLFPNVLISRAKIILDWLTA